VNNRLVLVARDRSNIIESSDRNAVICELAVHKWSDDPERER
jgi:hypothetical protein